MTIYTDSQGTINCFNSLKQNNLDPTPRQMFKEQH